MTEQLQVRYKAVSEAVSAAALRAGRDPKTIRVIAVSKTQPLEVMQSAIAAGIPVFGENYAQELKDKASALVEITDTNDTSNGNQNSNQNSIEWHFIGHLQTNKVKMIAPFVHCIHSVDSERLAKEISKVASNLGRTIDILLQVNTSGEESKSGCEPNEIYAIADTALALPNIRVRGLMTIAAFSDDAEFVRPMFRLLRNLRDELRQRHPEAASNGAFDELSMGMSGDYEAAIQEGATMVRIGTAIFGAREKNS